MDIVVDGKVRSHQDVLAVAIQKIMCGKLSRCQGECHQYVHPPPICSLKNAVSKNTIHDPQAKLFPNPHYT